MAHATPEDLIHFHDEMVVSDLLSDSGEPIVDLANHPGLLALLRAAAGRVEAACSVANLYQPKELAQLAGNSEALLKEIECDLAMIRLLRRRPGKYEAIQAQVKDAEDYLDRLRKGERIFGGIAEVREAGLPQVEGPSIATYERLNLIPDRTKHFYPHRSGRLPIGRG
jgi:hypothetical protein